MRYTVTGCSYLVLLCFVEVILINAWAYCRRPLNFDHGGLDGEFGVYHEYGGPAKSGSYKKGVPDGGFPQHWGDGFRSRARNWAGGQLEGATHRGASNTQGR